MSLAADGGYDDLGHGYVRKPISVAQLMEREGFRPAARTSVTRRALSGVAAGAVLALGAVVGSLLLNHGGATPTGDTLASGTFDPGLGQSGAKNVQVAQADGQAAGTTGSQNTVNASTGTPTNGTGTAVADGPAPAPPVVSSRANVSVGTINGSVSASVTTPRNGPPSASVSASVDTPPVSVSATVSTPAPAPSSGKSVMSPPVVAVPVGSAAQPSSPAAPAPSGGSGTAAATTSGSSGGSGSHASGGGGLLGTISGVLGDVTQPVFSWFGG